MKAFDEGAVFERRIYRRWYEKFEVGRSFCSGWAYLIDDNVVNRGEWSFSGHERSQKGLI